MTYTSCALPFGTPAEQTGMQRHTPSRLLLTLCDCLQGEAIEVGVSRRRSHAVLCLHLAPHPISLNVSLV